MKRGESMSEFNYGEFDIDLQTWSRKTFSSYQKMKTIFDIKLTSLLWKFGIFSFELMKSCMCQSTQKRYSLCDIQTNWSIICKLQNCQKQRKCGGVWLC